MPKLWLIHSKKLGCDFYAYKADKHFSVSNGTGTASGAAQPGNYIMLDAKFNIYVFNRDMFKKCFGHEWLQKLDEDPPPAKDC
jgi:hypothetical protein